jgi:hypothetical protein
MRERVNTIKLTRESFTTPAKIKIAVPVPEEESKSK